MYRIYIDDDLTSSSYDLSMLYSPEKEHLADGLAVYNVSVDKELNSAGSANFTVPITNPLYNRITKLKTMVFIFWDAELLWTGRVLSITYDLDYSKSVSCEGTLSFLNDIQIKPFMYKGASIKRTLQQHFETVFAIYNNRCSPKRAFRNASVDLPDEFKSTDGYSATGVTSYTSVKDEIDNIRSMNSSVGLSVSYQGLGTPTLIFAKTPFRTVNNVIEFGYNMMSFNEDEDGSNVFTTLIPLGDDNITIDDESYTVPSASLINKYGIIERTVQLDGVKNKETLRRLGEAVISAAEKEEMPTLTIKAVDLKWLDPNNVTSFIEVGDAVPVKFPHYEINHYYMCTKVSLDFDNIADTTYTLSYLGTGIPADPLGYEVDVSSYVRNDNTLSGYVLNNTKSMEAQRTADVQRPTDISVSSNRVEVTYPGYSVVYQATGTGASRSSITSTVVNEEESP